tara:strand:+ start:2662 stop:3042 length:381 start_codon:yes stop_codon:yes gene_type:complete
MATLNENSPFFNEILFGDSGTYANGVSGIAVSDDSTAKVLFNVTDLIPGAGNTTVVTTSAKINDVNYEIDLFNGYHGSVLAVINGERLATQFTFNSADGSAFQTVSAQGNNSVGPTLRRLYHLGYV